MDKAVLIYFGALLSSFNWMNFVVSHSYNSNIFVTEQIPLMSVMSNNDVSSCYIASSRISKFPQNVESWLEGY